jgi:hypothetical protein
MPILDAIEALRKRLANTRIPDQEKLLSALDRAADAVRTSDDQAGDGEPARAVAALGEARIALARVRAALEGTDEAKSLQEAADRVDGLIDARLASFRGALERLVGRMLLQEGNRSYLREIRNRAVLGPPILEDGELKVFLKVRSAPGFDDDIGDLTGTCGIWFCPGDTCICHEWECTLDGPGGSFP